MSETTFAPRLSRRRRWALALSIGVMAALTGAVYALAGHQQENSTIVSYTGCLAPTTGTLSRFAVGDVPNSPCPQSSVEMHLSGSADPGIPFVPSDRVFSSGVVRMGVGEFQIIPGPNNIQFHASGVDSPVTATLSIAPPTFIHFWGHSFSRRDFAFFSTPGGSSTIATATFDSGAIEGGTFSLVLTPPFDVDPHLLNGHFLVIAEVGSRRCRFQITAISD